MRKPNPFSVLSSIRKKFFDDFARDNTSGDLGFSRDGRRWDAIRGIFEVFLGSAFARTSSDYPIASVTMPYEDVKISISPIDVGSGAALWVTDSGNWWGLGLEQEEVDCNCSFGTDCNRWNQGGLCDRWNVGNCNRWNARNCRTEECAEWACSSFNASNCRSWTETRFCAVFACTRWEFFGTADNPRFRCVTWNCIVPGSSFSCTGGFNTSTCRSNTCVRNECTRFNAANCNRWNTRNCNRWTVESCNRWFEFAFDCEKCYPQWIRVVQSINTTISTRARFLITKTFTIGTSPFGGFADFRQTTFINKAISAMRFFVKSREIKADLFYEQDFTDKVDVEEEIVYNATGATVTPSYGILIVPSQNGQNTVIGSIDIDKN